MGYAVIATGGKQYKVREGDIVHVERVDGKVGSSVAFDNVLLYKGAEEMSIGTPVLENAVVEGHIRPVRTAAVRNASGATARKECLRAAPRFKAARARPTRGRAPNRGSRRRSSRTSFRSLRLPTKTTSTSSTKTKTESEESGRSRGIR